MIVICAPIRRVWGNPLEYIFTNGQLAKFNSISAAKNYLTSSGEKIEDVIFEKYRADGNYSTIIKKKLL